MKIEYRDFQEVYGEVTDQIRRRGVPTGFEYAKESMRRQISPNDLREEGKELVAYLARLNSGNRLEGEVILLVHYLMLEACVFDQIGYMDDETDRQSIEQCAKDILLAKHNRGSYNLRENFAEYLALWPFNTVVTPTGKLK